MSYYLIQESLKNSDILYFILINKSFNLFKFITFKLGRLVLFNRQEIIDTINTNVSWSTLRPPVLYKLYPIDLPIIQDSCYSGYTYEDPNFEGEYFGVSYTPTNQILFIYKQFNTDIIFQSIYPPTSTFKTPSNSSILQIETDLNNQFIGIKLDNLDDVNLLLT